MNIRIHTGGKREKEEEKREGESERSQGRHTHLYPFYNPVLLGFVHSNQQDQQVVVLHCSKQPRKVKRAKLSMSTSYKLPFMDYSLQVIVCLSEALGQKTQSVENARRCVCCDACAVMRVC